MQKVRKSYVYIIVITFLLFWGSCQSPVKTNVLQSSFDINQSKSNGVFVTEYIPSIKELNFKGKSFFIQEVWIEHYWIYKDQKRNIEIDNAIVGFIKLKNDEDIFELNFKLDSQRSGGITGRKLFFNISELKDTMSFKFYFNNDTIPVLMHRK